MTNSIIAKYVFQDIPNGLASSKSYSDLHKALMTDLLRMGIARKSPAGGLGGVLRPSS